VTRASLLEHGARRRRGGARRRCAVAGAVKEPPAEPKHDCGDATQGGHAFMEAAARLEQLAVAAYNGQPANVTAEVLVAAARIVSVEARHAAHAAGRSKNDVSVLNYAPSLEYPQAALYTESERSKALNGRAAEAATQVEAYEGQAPRLHSKQVLAAALGIHTVEARHAAWMRHLNGIEPAASAFDNPRPKKDIDRILRATGFVAQKPHMTARRRPRYTG